MSENVWIYKSDGTLQCGLGEEIPLAEMQKELKTAGVNVLKSEKRNDCAFHPAVCGAPTGRVNAFMISRDDWEKFQSGIIGTLGYRLWTCDGKEDVLRSGEIPWPLMREMASTRRNPILIRELIGRKCRVYTQGDALTEDFIFDRVNIELTKEGTIADIWFG